MLVNQVNTLNSKKVTLLVKGWSSAVQAFVALLRAQHILVEVITDLNYFKTYIFNIEINGPAIILQHLKYTLT